jgi:hypothetical protein
VREEDGAGELASASGQFLCVYLDNDEKNFFRGLA